MTVSIQLGTEDRVSQLYSFPNSPTSVWTLAETVKHWFDMTLDRDGLAAKGARAGVSVDGEGYVLKLDGPDSVQDQLKGYATRLPQFLSNGWAALTIVVPKIKADGRWDASPDQRKPDEPPYRPWRFFLPHGMAMLNQKALLFFHYPPIRLLDTNQDYLDDPVPVRCEELLMANGVSASDLPLFNTVLDATPIGAEDDQGSKKGNDGKPVVDPVWGAIPIQYFHDYQKAQVELLLNTSLKNAGYTVPIVVYGAHPLATFNELYGLALKNSQVTVVEIIPGKKTAVMASTHPYVFYGAAQGFDAIGSGKLTNRAAATWQMIADLVVARWLKSMSDNPAQNPQALLKNCQTYWLDPTVTALVNHQGSLFYSNPATLSFKYLIPLQSVGQLATAASRPAEATPVSSAQPTVAAPSGADAASSFPELKPGSLSARDDSGNPVDWWFIYKVSGLSESSKNLTAKGTEYAYFDADTAKRNGKLILSPNTVDQNRGALFSTLSQVYDSARSANKKLGWYFYNDEDPQKPVGYSNDSRGHCKGVLAFDLETDSAFWLVQSTPRFPVPKRYRFPTTGKEMAQTFLCITLPNADAAKTIAELMYSAHGPNVYLASHVPAALAQDDPRAQLMQDKVASPKDPVHRQVPFVSRGGQNFLAIAKNKTWGDPKKDPEGKKDFYNDLVGPTLAASLEVETWERTQDVPLDPDSDKIHRIENMKSVNLESLGIAFSWSEENDHAKLAISDRSEKTHWVCVGDINFTTAQEKRGGGTVAFQCEPLWGCLVQALSNQPEPAKKPSAGTRRTAAQRKKSAVPARKAARAKAAKKTRNPARKATRKPADR